MDMMASQKKKKAKKKKKEEQEEEKEKEKEKKEAGLLIVPHFPPPHGKIRVWRKGRQRKEEKSGENLGKM